MIDEKPFLTDAQMAARAKRAKTYRDKVVAVRASWTEGDLFSLPASPGNGYAKPVEGVFIRVTLDDKRTTFPYMVAYTDYDGKERLVSLSRFHDTAARG